MAMSGKHSLLIVDDEPDLVQSVKDLLRREYHVLGATRASEGLEILEREPVDIVMTDQRMPEMTGVEFLRRLRETYPDTTRLLFTAYSDINAVTEAINQGNVFRYIAKPWHPDELRATLRQAAEHHDLVRDRKRLLVELQDKNRQLESANQELRRANELKRAFIKVASHELKTPLTIVMGLSELGAGCADVPDDLRHWLQRIHVGSQRLNERVDQMFNFLMAGRFEKPLQRQQVSLRQLLRAAAAEVVSFIEKRSQTLTTDLPEDLGTASVEEDKIRDSVIQLLMNAIKFTPDGGTIRLLGRRLPAGGVEVKVSDTGVGMDAASLARVFDPFFTRFDVSRHCSGVFEFDRRGLGLGLSVAKAFVDMHGGQLKVESTVGKGSTFTIVLPPG
jgi:signal transduction histidine kinase